MLVVAIVRLAVWLTRRILWVLMQVGHVVSGFLSRQMEYDADRYEARMVGGEGFAETMWRFRVMSLAESGAYTDLQTSWQQRRLPDNFPKLVTANIPQIPEPVIAACRQQTDKLSTKLFDTHPADRDRIARARREEPGRGLFHLDGPATDVFTNFDALSRTASLDMYKSALGTGISSEQLYEVSELVETQTAAQEGDAAAGRWFLNAWNLTQRLPLSQEYPGAPGDLKSAKRDLIEARNDLLATRRACLEANGRGDEIRNRLYMADLALVFLKTSVWFKPDAFELKTASPKAAESARDQAVAALGELDEVCAAVRGGGVTPAHLRSGIARGRSGRRPCGRRQNSTRRGPRTCIAARRIWAPMLRPKSRPWLTPGWSSRARSGLPRGQGSEERAFNQRHAPRRCGTARRARGVATGRLATPSTTRLSTPTKT